VRSYDNFTFLRVARAGHMVCGRPARAGPLWARRRWVGAALALARRSFTQPAPLPPTPPTPTRCAAQVPSDQPEAAFNLINTFLADKSWY
jgi:hypothetical protein